MIISKTPFRMSYVGGGTDLRAFYKDEPGAVVSTSIDKYMYVALHKKFDEKIRIAYSSVEEVEDISQIKHPLVRESLLLTNLNSGVEITSTADIPGKGTGLGSSSSYTVGLLKAIHEYQSIDSDPYEIASLACCVEINKCGEPIGKQDQFAASFGGLRMYEFMPDESVNIHDIKCTDSFKNQLNNSSISFYLGTTRSASKILEVQKEVSKKSNKKLVLRRMAQIAHEFKSGIENSSIDNLVDLMNENWSLKKSLTSHISNTFVDDVFKTGLDAGAWAGKLLGAGGGGFVTFLAPKRAHKRIKEKLSNLRKVSLKMEDLGSQIIHK